MTAVASLDEAANGANGFPTHAPIELEDRPRRHQWLIDALLGASGGRTPWS